MVYISDVKDHEGKEVEICGWLYNKRSSGKIRFLLIRDGSGVIQAVVSKADMSEEDFETTNKLTQESSLKITGKINKDKRSPGGYEMIASKIEAIQIAEEYPISLKEHGVSFLMDHRHLWLRSSRQNAIMKIRDETIKACRDFFDSRGFILFDAPIFTPNACEGTTTLFDTNYFNEKAYLTQSGQLYGEAGAMAFGRVYVFGPTFRAEPSKTRRHLTEFWMIEPEVAFNDLEDNMKLAEDFVSSVMQRILETRKEELKVLERDVSKLEKVIAPFPRIRYDDAVKILHENGQEFEWGDDFGGEHETIISNQFEKPVFVTHYPAAIKAFYMKHDPENDDLALGCDLLAPEGYGEVIGGGQREDSLENLVSRINEHKLPMEAFEWYLDLRRYGSVPHSGFGMGLERFITWACGINHLRETIPFPRLMHRLNP